MSKAKAFNSLGQIIEEGGVKSVAIQLVHGKSESQVVNWLRSRYQGITEQATTQAISLARGGVEAAARAAVEIGDPVSDATLASLQGKGGPSPSMRTILRAIRRQQLPDETMSAANVGAGTLPLTTAELIPELFGDNPAGRRAELSVDIWLPEHSQSIRFDFELTGDESIDELLDEATNRFQRIIESDPTRFDYLDVREVQDIVFGILFFARRF